MSDRIRLMQITHDLAVGGLQRVVVNLCRNIDRDVYDVAVLCLRGLGAFADDVRRLGIEVILVPQEARTDYLSFVKVGRILRRRRIDVIHTHNTQPFVDGTLGALLGGVKTIVHTDHARSFPDKRRYMLAERLMSLLAYRVVGVSEDASRKLATYEGISRRKIETIHNGIDCGSFPTAFDREAKRRELGITAAGPIIGVGVRLTRQKGIVYLLRALPSILREIAGVTLVVAGEGPLEEDLRTEAAGLGVAPNVKFLGARSDMPELLKLFDVCVLPSLWEGLPMIVLEAMALGCPILATDVGGVAEAVEDGVTGVLVPPQDPAALARETIRLLKDEELRRRYAEAGLDVFRARFTAATMTRRYERLYRRAS